MLPNASKTYTMWGLGIRGEFVGLRSMIIRSYLLPPLTPRPSKKMLKSRLLGLLLVCSAFYYFSFVSTNMSPYSTGSVAFAQEDGDVAPESDDDEVAAPSQDDTESYLVWYLKALGPIFAPAFFILSVFFVTLVVLNWMAITRDNIMPQTMLTQFTAQLEEKNYQEAYETAKASDSPQGKILAAGLAKIGSGYEIAQQAMADVAEEEITRLEQRLGYVSMISGLAPMLGLLGTVYGMVASFNVIARSTSAPQANELASGISTALITTEVGLFIAIPAVLCFEFLRNKLALLVLELNVQTENLMSRFKGQ